MRRALPVAVALLTVSCDPPARAPRGAGATRTATTAEAAAAPRPRVRVELVSELTELDVRAFRRRTRLRLPRYRPTFRSSAAEHELDWRLLVAMAYVESHLDPLAESRTGVRGLMQLTRVTADAMGVGNRLNPHQSIVGGARYLDRLHGRFDEVLEFDRTQFAMASYNVGYGHVRDAQRLATRRGLDPDVWPSLEETLPLLADEQIAALTRYGRARGYEPVAYVRSICNYFVLQKRDACQRREALGLLVLGERHARRPPHIVPEGLVSEVEDGVAKLPWSHPFVCALDDCKLFARFEALHPEDTVTAAR